MPALANRWAVLALLCFARISMGLSFQSVPALTPFLVQDFGISYAELGFLLGLYQLPGVFVSLPGGVLGARFGDKPLVLVALTLLSLGGVLFAIGASWPTVVVARLLTGVGGVLLNMQLTKIITDWFVGRELSTALGLLLPMWPLGITLALATLAPLASLTSWRLAVGTTAAYPGLALVLVALLYRDRAPVRQSGGRPALWAISSQEVGLVTLAGASWMFLNTGFIVFMSFAPTLLISRGLSVAHAGFLVSLVSLLSVGSVPLAGYLTDRTRCGHLFIGLGTVASALAVFAFVLSEPALLWIVLFGLALGGPVPAIVALPSEVLRPESRNTGFGAWNTVYYGGMTVLPPVAGYALDLTGSAVGPVWLAGLLWVMILPPFWLLRSLRARWAPRAN